MGIIVSDLELQPGTGLVVPEAYIAISRNNVTLTPQDGGTYRVNATYAIWGSYELREADKKPTSLVALSVLTEPGMESIHDVYASVYDCIKNKYSDKVVADKI